MCSCFDCLRAKGITNNNRLDHRRRRRYPPDGRYTLKMIRIEDPEDGTKLNEINTGERGEYVGT